MDYQTNDYRTNSHRRNPYTTPSPLSELSDPDPPPQPLLEGILSRPGLYLLLGYYQSKKTRTCLDLALSIALGKPWLNHPTHQTHVLWLDGESSHRHFFPRAVATLHAHKAPPQIPFHISFLAGSRLNSPSLLDTITHFVQEHHSGLVIIDPISWAFTSSFHFSPPDLIPLLHKLSHLAQQHDLAFLFTNHTSDFETFTNYPPLTNLIDRLFLLRSFPVTPYIDIESPASHTAPALHLTAQLTLPNDHPWRTRIPTKNTILNLIAC